MPAFRCTNLYLWPVIVSSNPGSKLHGGSNGQSRRKKSKPLVRLQEVEEYSPYPYFSTPLSSICISEKQSSPDFLPECLNLVLKKEILIMVVARSEIPMRATVSALLSSTRAYTSQASPSARRRLDVPTDYKTTPLLYHTSKTFVNIPNLP